MHYTNITKTYHTRWRTRPSQEEVYNTLTSIWKWVLVSKTNLHIFVTYTIFPLLNFLLVIIFLTHFHQSHSIEVRLFLTCITVKMLPVSTNKKNVRADSFRNFFFSRGNTQDISEDWRYLWSKDKNLHL